jgi:small subunit ribosomal protein S20
MPHRHCALKKLRKDKKRRLRNLKIKRDLKKTIKKFQALLESKDIESARSFLSKVYSKLDKAAKKRVIHPNKARRLISRLTRKVPLRTVA